MVAERATLLSIVVVMDFMPILLLCDKGGDYRGQTNIKCKPATHNATKDIFFVIDAK